MSELLVGELAEELRFLLTLFVFLCEAVNIVIRGVVVDLLHLLYPCSTCNTGSSLPLSALVGSNDDLDIAAVSVLLFPVCTFLKQIFLRQCLNDLLSNLIGHFL